ncbi:MAG TPA: Sir2 family NAD-dependent protein deacetylase [Paenalcaligenes sp.]|nr:Sir2 family NAD-dependent protein deacetylase [Paenalcaligenes sp.]
MQPKIFIFTGSGISAESGLTTFRGSDGLWNDHSIDDVCNEHTWRHNYALVHDFYNDLRRTLADSEPNQGHHSIANIQKKYGDAVDIVTQNVDDLLERAGAHNVLHLHGDLTELCCADCGHEWAIGYTLVDLSQPEHTQCPSCQGDNHCVRPNIVFFGGPAPYYQTLYQWLAQASHPHSLFVVSGTQGNVVPIDSLLAQVEGKKVLNNLEPSPYIDEQHYAHVLYAPATEAWPQIEAFIDEHIKEHW